MRVHDAFPRRVREAFFRTFNSVRIFYKNVDLKYGVVRKKGGEELSQSVAILNLTAKLFETSQTKPLKMFPNFLPFSSEERGQMLNRSRKIGIELPSLCFRSS